MSRKSLANVLALSLVLFPVIALAQTNVALDPITLVVGPSYHLPTGPEYSASGDIDNDGLDDAVIASTREDFVSALISDGNGGFRTLITFPVSHRLGDVATLDFNGDGNLDIVAIDQRGGIDVMSGLGDGRFNPPIFYRGDRLGQGVAVGDLDNQNGPDIVTANGRSKNISVFMNRGGNLGFLQGTEFGVGGDVIGDDVRIDDFNSDGFNDIAVLNVRNREADEISLLLNNTRAQFNTVTKFLVNARAVSMTDGDWNGDGIPDLVSLEQGENFVNMRQFSATVLVNRTTVVDGVVKGTGIFEQLERVPISCPGNFNGAPIVCTVQDIESGDFNADGHDDIVISIDSRFEQDIGLATPGLIQAYLGLGDGDFNFSTRVNVGQRPRGMAIGDTNGDLLDDIILAEFRAIGFDPESQDTDDNNGRIIRSIYPPLRDRGDTCGRPEQCEDGNCVNNYCCATPSCPEGQRCDIPGHEGTCTPVGNPGAECDFDEQCDPPFCVDGFCCTSASCPASQFCNTGTCAPPAGPGNNCTANNQCNPPYCVNGTCCTQPACPFGQRCDLPPPGMCRPLLGIGEPCTENAQCQANLSCTDGVCCTSENCGPGRSCSVVGHEGVCTNLPTPTPTVTRTPTPLPNGSACMSDGQCVSGNCTDNTCCSTASCPSGQRCNISSSPGVCATPVGPNEPCQDNDDCASGNCNGGNCGPPYTPTPRGPGAPCETTSQCQAGFECNVAEGHICCEDLVCPTGSSCRVPGHEGFCFNLPTPTPTKLPNGDPCVTGPPCQSGNCVNQVCCADASCPGSSRCDIRGTRGRCAPPLPEGSVCDTNSDCAPGLLCLVDEFGVRRCTIPDITPTIIPTLTPTQTSAPTIIVDRDDGGCSIDDQHRSGSLWALALFPLFLGLRRHELRESPVRRRRR